MLLQWFLDAITFLKEQFTTNSVVQTEPIYLNENLWAAVAGTVVGSLLTGGISIYLHRRVRLDSISDRNEERKKKSKALCISLLVKLMTIEQRLFQINEHLEESRRKLAENHSGQIKEIWQVTQPLANRFNEISFTSDEMFNLLEVGGDDLFNGINSLDNCYNSTVKNMSDYRNIRSLLTREMAPVEDDGQVGISFVDDVLIRKLRPLMMEANSLIEGIEQWLPEHTKWSHKAIHNLKDAMKVAGISKDPKIVFDRDPERLKKEMANKSSEN